MVVLLMQCTTGDSRASKVSVSRRDTYNEQLKATEAAVCTVSAWLEQRPRPTASSITGKREASSMTLAPNAVANMLHMTLSVMDVHATCEKPLNRKRLTMPSMAAMSFKA